MVEHTQKGWNTPIAGTDSARSYQNIPGNISPSVVDPNTLNFYPDLDFWPNLDPDPGLLSFLKENFF